MIAGQVGKEVLEYSQPAKTSETEFSRRRGRKSSAESLYCICKSLAEAGVAEPRVWTVSDGIFLRRVCENYDNVLYGNPQAFFSYIGLSGRRCKICERYPCAIAKRIEESPACVGNSVSWVASS